MLLLSLHVTDRERSFGSVISIRLIQDFNKEFSPDVPGQMALIFVFSTGKQYTDAKRAEKS